MPVKRKVTWLLLLVRLPATHQAERVAIWRKLRKSGSIPIQTSTYLLPDRPVCRETFQWLTQHIRDAGGDATLVRAGEIQGLSDQKIIGQFNAARGKEYAILREQVRSLDGRSNRTNRRAGRFEQLRKQFREIRETDFFESGRGDDIELLLRNLKGSRLAGSKPPKSAAAQYRNRTWMTRPHPEIDRVGSAWLIRRFIDQGAKFVFSETIPAGRRFVTFDMLEADFSHRRDDCTFETLLKTFHLDGKPLRKIGEMIHEADLNDGKFERIECIGLDRVFKGWAKQGLTDQEILRRGFECFDALYAFLDKR